MAEIPQDLPRVVPALGMTTEEFRKRGKAMIDMIADYYDNIESYRVRSGVEPGYLVNALPEEAPSDPESWDSILQDVSKLILPGVTHFQSPKFYAYYPAEVSFPAHLGDLLSGTFGMIGFSWINGPALTELENVSLNWIRKMLDLPDFFHNNGVIQGTASEGTFVSALAARDKVLRENKDTNIHKLVGYCSNQVHGSLNKALRLAGILPEHIRGLEVEVVGPEIGRLNADTLRAAIEEDIANGLTPFFVCATLGTTGVSACDDLQAVGMVCNDHNIWMHVDAAYAGTALMCEEFRPFAFGMEMANSFLFNPHKWMMVNFDCSVLFVKERVDLIGAMSSDMSIFHNEASQSGRVVDYKDWQIPLGRRFRALKLWMVLRTFGVKGLQAHIRRHVHQAKYFESLVEKDERLVKVCAREFGLVCFRVKVPSTTSHVLATEGQVEVSNKLQAAVTEHLNSTGDIFITPSSIAGHSYLRFVLCSSMSEMKHVQFAWECISKAVDHALMKVISQ